MSGAPAQVYGRSGESVNITRVAFTSHGGHGGRGHVCHAGQPVAAQPCYRGEAQSISRRWQPIPACTRSLCMTWTFTAFLSMKFRFPTIDGPSMISHDD